MLEIKKPYVLYFSLILLVTSLLAGGRFPYMFTYVAVLVFLIPYLWLRRSFGKLAGEIRVSSTYGEVGQTITVYYRLENAWGGWFPYVELSNITGTTFGEDEGTIISLDQGETADFQRQVRCARRGKYDVKALGVRTGDPFGIFQLYKPLTSGVEIKVYPRLRSLPELVLSAQQHFGDLAVNDRQFEDYSQVSDIREWQHGDSIKRIHWKQSARHEELIVKNFALRGEASLTIFVDMADKSYKHDRKHRLEDLAVETAASLLYSNLREGIPVQIFSQHVAGGGLQGWHFRDYGKIMDILITLAPSGQESFSHYLHHRSFYLTPKSTLYLLTPRLNLSEAAAILSLKERGFSPVLIYLVMSPISTDELAMLERVKQAGVKVHPLYGSEEAKNENGIF